MSGPIEHIGFAEDEPAVTHPMLRRMVEAAASQSTPRLRLDARALTAAFVERRAQRRRTAVLVAAAGIGAVAIAGLLGRGTLQERRATSDGVAVTAPERTAQPPVAPELAEVASPTQPPTQVERAPSLPALASAVHTRPEPVDSATDYEVAGPWALVLRDGGLRVEVDDDAAEPALVTLPEGRLEIRTGVTIVQVAGDVATVTVESGSAVRIDADGTRHELRPTKTVLGRTGAARKGPSELAALAEERIAVGDRAAAIKHLTTLVRRYPSSAPARTGLIDLARLLKATGRRDEARCAYQLFLARNPRAALRTEVERAIETLGEGPTCTGLTPTPR